MWAWRRAISGTVSSSLVTELAPKNAALLAERDCL